MATLRRDWKLRSFLVAMMFTLVAVISVTVVGLVFMGLKPRVDAETKLQISGDVRVAMQRAGALAKAMDRRLVLVGASLDVLPAPAVAAYLQLLCAEDAMLVGLAIEAADGGVVTRCADAPDGPVHSLSKVLKDGRRLVLSFGQARLVDELMAPFRLRNQIDFDRSSFALVDAQGRALASTNDVADGGPESDPRTGVPQQRAEGEAGLFGWRVVASAPAGWNHPRVRRGLLICGMAILGNLLLGLALTPLWSRRMVGAVKPLVDAARQVAAGDSPKTWPRGPIRELNGLSSSLAGMAHSLEERQLALQTLNAELEARVAQRTEALAAMNAELKQSFERLQATRDHLQRAEKLASLGGLVAGVAHELNTPLGNGLMAVSTLRDDLQQFRGQLAGGLRQSALDRFVLSVEQGTGIASRNLERAADLVTSFKQIAVDQTSEHRRKFDLQTLVREILLTLRPSFARTPYTVAVEVDAGLQMDSYPGALGQILTNLVTNAIVHGFDGRDHGVVTVRAQRQADAQVTVQVLDDGRGVADAVIERIFEPFVTTRMGRGGTGLGLHIAHTSASHILGGSLTVSSPPGQGAVFTLCMPCVAPRRAAAPPAVA